MPLIIWYNLLILFYFGIVMSEFAHVRPASSWRVSGSVLMCSSSCLRGMDRVSSAFALKSYFCFRSLVKRLALAVNIRCQWRLCAFKTVYWASCGVQYRRCPLSKYWLWIVIGIVWRRLMTWSRLQIYMCRGVVKDAVRQGQPYGSVQLSWRCKICVS